MSFAHFGKSPKQIQGVLRTEGGKAQGRRNPGSHKHFGEGGFEKAGNLKLLYRAQKRWEQKPPNPLVEGKNNINGSKAQTGNLGTESYPKSEHQITQRVVKYGKVIGTWSDVLAFMQEKDILSNSGPYKLLPYCALYQDLISITEAVQPSPPPGEQQEILNKLWRLGLFDKVSWGECIKALRGRIPNEGVACLESELHSIIARNLVKKMLEERGWLEDKRELAQRFLRLEEKITGTFRILSRVDFSSLKEGLQRQDLSDGEWDTVRDAVDKAEKMKLAGDFLGLEPVIRKYDSFDEVLSAKIDSFRCGRENSLRKRDWQRIKNVVTQAKRMVKIEFSTGLSACPNGQVLTLARQQPVEHSYQNAR